jgi:hypothetical protein
MSRGGGNSRGALAERKDDLYETPACAVEALLRTGELPDRNQTIWEPCAGRGAILRVLRAHGFWAIGYDLNAHPGADPSIQSGIDFLMERRVPHCSLIVTNPPFKLANKFIRHGLSLGCRFIALLRLAALEGANRSDIIDVHLRRVWVGKERLPMMHREGWDGPRIKGGAVAFAWFVFEPGVRHGPIELNRISWRTAGR